MKRRAQQPLELAAPAGDWDALRAAVANGADAVYFGLSAFNARLRAANFTIEGLPEVLAYLHGHNVRGYVTFNTLVFSNELPQAVEMLRAIAEAGADAVIVQDLGIAELVRRLAPSLPIHASTQMTLTAPRAIRFAQQLGVRRVVLPRELSLDQIRRIADETEVELEAFVHGALCISYSGQCLASESLGGRSANRGLCAQPCRLPYELIADEKPLAAPERRYPLSTHDLAAWDLVPAMVAAGVRSFKIEGRLKSAHYVAAATRLYRAALDAAARGEPFSPAPRQLEDLAQSFSRGFTQGFLEGVNHQQLVDGRSPKSCGVRIGPVVAKTARSLVVDTSHPSYLSYSPLKPGDGVVFDEGKPDQPELGGRIFAVRQESAPHRMEISFGRNDLNIAKVPVGSTLWKTDDPEVRKRMEQTWARDLVVKRAPITVRVRAALGEPLQIQISDDVGSNVRGTWDHPLERAEKHPLSLNLVREQFGRLGGTPFELRAVEAEKLDPVMVPKSVLNDLRRQAVESLMKQREAAARHPITEPDVLSKLRQEAQPRRLLQGSPVPQLYVLVHTLDHLDAVLSWQPSEPSMRPALVYCDFEDPPLCEKAVSRTRAAGMAIGLAPLRIIKPGEEDSLRQILDLKPDTVLVRNLTALSFFREHAPDMPLVGDFSLNVANDITAGLLAVAGLARIVPSYDLNWKQMITMIERSNPRFFEVVIHQHVPMFHMEHCLFAAILSKGKDPHSCGRPCRHKVELRDRVGAEHPLLADAACRNTLFNASVQSAAEFLPDMLRLGLRHFRVEMLRESPMGAQSLLECYARLLARMDDGRATWRRLHALCPSGVIRGTLQSE